MEWVMDAVTDWIKVWCFNSVRFGKDCGRIYQVDNIDFPLLGGAVHLVWVIGICKCFAWTWHLSFLLSSLSLVLVFFLWLKNSRPVLAFDHAIFFSSWKDSLSFPRVLFTPVILVECTKAWGRSRNLASLSPQLFALQETGSHSWHFRQRKERVLVWISWSDGEYFLLTLNFISTLYPPILLHLIRDVTVSQRAPAGNGVG